MKVEILSRKLMKPASPTPPNLRRLKISSMDQLQPPIFVAYILYYEANGAENVVERSKHLQKSLSETLTLFYPLAGRYIKDNFEIDCNDEGVLYLEAQVGGQLAQLQQGEIKAELLNHLVPRAMESATTPLVHIQFNMFECGGLAIGLRVAHRIADGFTSITFFNAWATACRATSFNELTRPSFDLASYFPPRENTSGTDDLPVIPLKVGAKIVTRRFVFEKAAISNLKDIASAGDDSTKKRQPSRVVVVTALIWKALISVAQAKHGHLRASIVNHLLNMRGKTALPVTDSSCGNFYTKAIARFDGDNESKMELHELLGVLDDSLRNTVANCMKQQNGDDLFSMVTNSFRELNEEFEKGETDSHTFSSWCRFPIYEVDFGWGKPIWATSIDKPVELTQLMDSKDGIGIEAWVSLEEKNMLLFQHHPDIIAFTS